jgi:hypothetical protein
MFLLRLSNKVKHGMRSKQGVKMIDEIKHVENHQLSRRGFRKYDKNPSLDNAIRATRSGVRKISNKSGDKLMIVSEHGEVVAPAGFYEAVDVDRTRFVKLYVSGVRAFQGLSTAGGRVFELIYGVVLDRPKVDRFTFHHDHFKDTGISSVTFRRGMRELLEKEFLFETPVQNEYWLNVDYMFNGNRLAFIKEYTWKNNKKSSKSGLVEG